MEIIFGDLKPLRSRIGEVVERIATLEWELHGLDQYDRKNEERIGYLDREINRQKTIKKDLERQIIISKNLKD